MLISKFLKSVTSIDNERGVVMSYPSLSYLNHIRSKNIGFFYCKKELANEFSKSKNWVSFLKKIARTGNMGYFLHKGRELTVNTPEELSYAKKKIKTLFS